MPDCSLLRKKHRLVTSQARDVFDNLVTHVGRAYDVANTDCWRQGTQWQHSWLCFRDCLTQYLREREVGGGGGGGERIKNLCVKKLLCVYKNI